MNIKSKIKNVVIIGAGAAGTDVLNELESHPDLGLNVLGFIDDDKHKIGVSVGSKKVLGAKNDLPYLAKKRKIDLVIIAIPSAEGDRIANYLKICSDLKLDVKIVPRVREIIEGKARVSTLRKVQVEDLLGRPVIRSDVSDLVNFFKGKKVLVTGAAGSIGSELSRQIAAYSPDELILLDCWENGLFDLGNELKNDFPKVHLNFVIANIRDKKKVKNVFREFEPTYVFHAAAYKHVPLMEENISEALKNNVLGTRNVVNAAVNSKTERFIVVSTDKAARPKSVMGATKLLTEGIAKINNDKKGTKIMTVRFGNVLDSFGSVIPTFRRQIESGGPVTITDKRMTRYFMTIPEASQLILKAASIGDGGELFVLDMGSPVKILDLAQNLIRLSGYIPGHDMDIIYTGIRPGEKLREQLFTTQEKKSLLKTEDKKIFITKSLELSLSGFDEKLDRLLSMVDTATTEELRKELRKLIKSLP